MIKDLTGKVFGKLSVINLIDKRTKHRSTIWLCLCECGNYKEVERGSLISGNVKSCGCIHKFQDRNSVYNKIILSKIKESSIRYKRNFLIPDEKVLEISKLNCYYCGISPSNCHTYKADKKKLFYHGLDRIDSNKEYTLDNVVPCCKICNRAKNNLSLKDFSHWLYNISNVFMKSKEFVDLMED